MKNILFILTLFIACSSFTMIKNHAVEPKPLMANEVMIPVGNNGNKVSLAEFVTMSPKEYQKISGKKLNIFDRIAFKIAQRKIRKSIDKDGTVNASKLAEMLKANKDKPPHPLPLWAILLIILGGIILLIIFMNQAFWRGK